VNAPVQYGPRIKAIMVYLYMGQYLSKHRTAVAMSELFNTPVSDGTVSAATTRAAGDLGGFCAAASKKIAGADVAHFDETGFRADGEAALAAFRLDHDVHHDHVPRPARAGSDERRRDHSRVHRDCRPRRVGTV
jgi:hypothetical protein